jgi:tRNA(fMet)-specific endonuclease VapC
MIILDTDHVSLLQHPNSEEAQRLLNRLQASSDRDIVTTVVTVEEQMRGWLQVIARYRDLRQQLLYYDKLIDFIYFFGKWKILPLREHAVQVFQDMQKSSVRISSTDLKIASITLSHNATLLTRNARDFERVSGLRFENWTSP